MTRPTSNPRAQTPNDDPRIAPADEPGATWAESLGQMVDEMRQLNTELGVRPYRVFVVTLFWDGGEVGSGEPTVRSELELLPTPFVDLRPVYVEMRSGGRVDQGTAMLREVSPRYTEDEIRGIFCGRPGCQVFVEVQHDSRDGLAERRRFLVKGVPWRTFDGPEGPQWLVRLASEQETRNRDGGLTSPQTFPERERV